MKYAVGMGSGAMIYIQSFIRFFQAFRRCYGGYTYIQSQTHREQGDLIRLLLFFPK
jgi:hypothetical protein